MKKMKVLDTRKKEFLDWVCQQDSEQEEHDIDEIEQQITKGTQR